MIKNAFYIARSGRPGVVVVDIPKDIQQAPGGELYPESVIIRGYKPSSGVHLGQIKKAAELLSRAKRPLFLAGGGCDVLCSIGTRFNDRITGKNGTFACGASIIHIDVDPASISRNIAVDIPIVADAGEAVRALLKRISKQLCCDRSNWLTLIHGWQTEHPLTEFPPAEHPLAEPPLPTPAVSGETTAVPDTVRPQWIFHQINRLFERAVISTDVGQNQLWATQFLELGPDRLLLTSGGLGNVRQWQELFYQKRYSGTCLRRRKSYPAKCGAPGEGCPPYMPDFIQLAAGYGAKGIRVTGWEEVEPAFLEARRNTLGPTVIEFMIGSEENVFPIVPPGSPLDTMVLKNVLT